MNGGETVKTFKRAERFKEKLKGVSRIRQIPKRLKELQNVKAELTGLDFQNFAPDQQSGLAAKQNLNSLIEAVNTSKSESYERTKIT